MNRRRWISEREKTLEKIQKLCDGVRAIGPGIEIRLKPSEDVPDQWSVMVIGGNGGAILIYTDFDTLDRALAQACSKLANISQRMMAAVRQSGSTPPPPPDTEKQ